MSDKGLVPRIYKEFSKLQSKKIENPVNKESKTLQ